MCFNFPWLLGLTHFSAFNRVLLKKRLDVYYLA